MANDSDCLEISTWRWYADGYRYPVFETIKSMAYRSGKCYEHFTTSFYYPPYGQSYDLNDDLENQLRRESTVYGELLKEGKGEDMKMNM